MSFSVLRRAVWLVLAAALGAASCAAALARHQPTPPPVLSSSDIGFAQDMSTHHQQAVTMTDMLATDSTPDVKALAEQIRVTQLNEIGQMTGWLQLAGAPPTSAHPMAWMSDADHHDTGHQPVSMPGMASAQELERLQNSVGAANQTQFLHLMIRHHQGGIDMAAHAFRHSTNDAVRRTASIMVDEQTQEVQLMAVMLDQHQENK
ncbi:DUF305 domain-containing protein [Mycobacterium sp. pUA109]|uniref:DUF305 domain-containing protein n=1 Tax=Mycobacterium sp. pUA109 TaxID=3238982 RepID=UPI00351B2186